MILHSLLHLSGGLLDPSALLNGAGPYVLVVIAAFVFIESGLLFPFLPGDSLLFTAALLSVPLALPIPLLVLVAAVAAVAGDQVGYLLGHRYGRRIFKPDARVFKTRYLERSDDFFTKYGSKALVLARFVPIVRTFVPAVVGMSHLPYRRFVLWNVVGGVSWVLVCTFAGMWLGKIPFVANNVDLIAVAIVVVSVLPIAISLLRNRRSSRTP
ncbi:VTT domain-containing protein [Leifsonia sp. Root112D2]|uniref:VTT domain-containing protein n=1 Tax=Leifsonia sp. Root112D2 TaxID=1736426 RepID=UPI0006F786AB|nr:VTT domain-containing protein [Leifsonia sp. Root112D2]KQV08141.1 alkaline phosphatase [Leifsonia sp. Root112D2]